MTALIHQGKEKRVITQHILLCTVEYTLGILNSQFKCVDCRAEVYR